LPREPSKRPGRGQSGSVEPAGQPIQAMPEAPRWLKQVHGSRFIHLSDWYEGVEADAAWTDQAGQVAAVITADCLPVLLADRGGSVVAAIHAGWRGLAGGVLESAIGALPVAPDRLDAWIGPAISRNHYEVGPEVRDAVVARGRQLADCFQPGRPGHFQADLPAIAESILGRSGVQRVRHSGRCTAGEPEFFHSYRRDGATGRMATVIWRS